MHKLPQLVWNGGTGHERDSHCMQDWAVTSQTKHVKAKKNNIDTSPPSLPRTPPSPNDTLSSRLKAKIENNLVFEDSDEQHDAEPGQHAQVLQDKVSQLAALVVLAVPVKHFWQLRERQSNNVGSKTDFYWD